MLVPIGYALALVTYLRFFLRESREFSKLARTALLVALGIHAAVVAVRYIGQGHAPLANAGEAITFFTFCIAAVYAFLETRTGTQSLGIFILTIVFAFQMHATFHYQAFGPIAEKLNSHWFATHAGTSIMSFSAFAIAAVASTIYVLLYRELHTGRPGFIFRRMPPLQTLDTMAYQGVLLGFVLLTIGMVTGMIWAKGAWGKYWSWDPKQCSALTMWLMYGTYLVIRKRGSWNGKHIAYFAMIGFLFLVFTFIILDVVFRTEHNFV